MVSSYNEPTLRDRCRGSLEQSLKRRVEAAKARRRKFRIRGSGMSVALVALAIGVVGTGGAVAQQLHSSAASAGLLREGSHGPAVAAVQRAIGIPADGAFGGRTEANVKLIQRKYGLTVDGIVGPQTRGALGIGGSASTTSSQAPVSAPAPAPNAPQKPASTSPPPAGGSNPALNKIAQCESGGDPHAIGGGGQFRGKYQFTRDTWAGVGGKGDPAAAPEGEQDRRAAQLYSQSGSGSWPVCGR